MSNIFERIAVTIAAVALTTGCAGSDTIYADDTDAFDTDAFDGVGEDAAAPGEATADEVEKANTDPKTTHIWCPTSLRARWAQAAFGREETIEKSSGPFLGALGLPDDELTCALDNVAPSDHITQVVLLEPGTPPFACNATVRFSGIGDSTGVPPFGGFQFRSRPVDAVPTYDEATGLCRLDAYLSPTLTKEDVNKECRSNSGFFVCPFGVTPD